MGRETLPTTAVTMAVPSTQRNSRTASVDTSRSSKLALGARAHEESANIVSGYLAFLRGGRLCRRRLQTDLTSALRQLWRDATRDDRARRSSRWRAARRARGQK